MIYEDELYHHGVKGQKWGVRRYQDYDGTLIKKTNKTSYGSLVGKKILNSMKDFKYTVYNGLKSPSKLLKEKTGECHSYCNYELNQLKKKGIKAEGIFFIEYNPKNSQGGQTHSFATYNENNKYYWIEKAWSTNEGVHVYNSRKEMLKDITNKHFDEQIDKSFSKLAFGKFIPEEHKEGESLQTLVNICLKHEFEI